MPTAMVSAPRTLTPEQEIDELYETLELYDGRLLDLEGRQSFVESEAERAVQKVGAFWIARLAQADAREAEADAKVAAAEARAAEAEARAAKAEERAQAAEEASRGRLADTASDSRCWSSYLCRLEDPPTGPPLPLPHAGIGPSRRPRSTGRGLCSRESGCNTGEKGQGGCGRGQGEGGGGEAGEGGGGGGGGQGRWRSGGSGSSDGGAQDDG